MSENKDKNAAPQQQKNNKKDQMDKLRKENEELTKSLEEQKAAVEKGKNDYLRLMAEFETFRRRSAEEKLAMVANASSDTIKGLLPVLDDCERALQILAGSADAAAKEGTELIYTKRMAYLKGRGLEPIDAKDKKFDTDFHEAVTQFPAPDESKKGMVIDVIQTGYLFNGKVLRFAKVVVGV